VQDKTRGGDCPLVRGTKFTLYRVSGATKFEKDMSQSCNPIGTRLEQIQGDRNSELQGGTKSQTSCL